LRNPHDRIELQSVVLLQLSSSFSDFDSNLPNLILPMKIRQGLTLALLAALLAGCQTVEYPPTSEHITPSTPVRLSPGDVLKITFSSSSELDQTQKIKIDGKVNLPLIGEVRAAGKTLIGFQREIADLYSSQLEENDILVTLDTDGANIIVAGQV